MPLVKDAEKYAHSLRNWIRPIFVEKKPALSTQRFCLTMTTHAVSIIQLDQTPDGPLLLAYDRLQYDNVESIPLLLTGFFNRQHYDNIPLYWLLAPNDYQFFLIESLPVTADEFREALHWRVRSLINYPTEEAVIDYFKLPAKKANSDSMVATAIAKKSALSAIVNTLKHCHANLSAIDIPELAMRNLTALYEEDEKSTAFIYFATHDVILNITRQRTLFFTRRLALSPEPHHDGLPYEQLCLDLLRYFDYYQSQWRHPIPTRIFVGSTHLHTAELAHTLSEKMLMTVEPFRVKSIAGDLTLLHTLEKEDLLGLGCALRQDNVYVKTGN